MFPESLRLRIQIWHGFLLAAVLTGLALSAFRYQSANELRRVDGELRGRVRALADGLPGPRGPGGPPAAGAAREFRLTTASRSMPPASSTASTACSTRR